MTLQFIADATNVVLVGPNGIGKSTCARNIGLPGAARRPHGAVRQRRHPARAIWPPSTAPRR